MTVRQAFFNGDRLDATASLLAPEPKIHDRVAAERETQLREYKRIENERFNAMDYANDAKRHGNVELAANWEGYAKAFLIALRIMEQEAPFLKEARR